MAKKSLRQVIAGLFEGKKSSKATTSTSSNAKKASRVSNYGGGYSSSYRATTSARKRDDDEKEKQRQKLAEQQKQTTAKLAEIANVSKRTDALSSGKKSLPPEPKALANNGVERAVKKIGEKSKLQKDLETIKADRDERNSAFHSATNHRYDVAEKGISKEERTKRRQNIRTATLGEAMGGRKDEAVDVMKAKMQYDRGGESFRRGLVNATTAGMLNLAEKRLNQGERKEAEEYYQQNKHKGAETLGSLAGGLLLYGGTAGTFENLGQKAVGRAAETEIGRKLGAEALARTMAGTGIKAGLARSLVGDTIQDSTIGAFDTTMDILARDDLETPGDYAKAFAKGQAANYAMGLAGNAVFNGVFPAVGRAAGNWWENFADQSRRLYAVQPEIAKTYDDLLAERKALMDDIFAKNENADPGMVSRLQEINAELKSIEEANPEIKARPKEKITDESVKKPSETAKTEEKITEEPVKNQPETAAPEEKITEGNVKNDTSRKPTKNEKKRAELQAERDELAERYRLAKENGAKKRELRQMLDDMQELDGMLKDLDGKIRKAEAKRTAKQTKAEVPTEEPRVEARAEEPTTELAPGTGRAEAGENAGAGERTEFRRGEEQTEREQARNRRAEGNRERATQESFDTDYDDFVRKANENQNKINELKGRLRAAASDEEKAALKQQIDELNREVKSAYNRASLRYHPDRGGSNEWMGKFNEAYDSFKRGSYSSRGFSGASSSTRTRAKASESAASGGNGGSTPPPRRKATPSGEGGFKKPKGKARKGYARTVESVEDVVYKRAERTPFVERAAKVVKDARMRISDSHAPFEDIARKFAKSNPEKMQNMYGSIDAHRRSNGYANRSIGEKQINYMGQAFKNGKSIKDIYKGMDENTERAFDAYLLLKHAPDRLREDKSIFKDIFAKNVMGKLDDPEVIKSEINRLLREHPEFEAKAEDIYQYTRNELLNLSDAGLIEPARALTWMREHPFYVPTHRAGFNDGLTSNIHGSVVGAGGQKAASGSDYDIRSIRDQLEEMTRQNWEDITLNDMLKDVFGDRIPKTTTALGESAESLERALGNSISIAKSADGKKFYAEVYIKGQKKRFEIEKEFVDALEDWNKHGKFEKPMLDVLNEGLSKGVKVYKGLITEWNPIFMVKNPLRDFPEAYINSRQSKEFRKCIGKAWKDLASGGEYSTALKNMGISQSSFFDLDKAILENAERSGLKKALGAVGDRLEAGNQFMEMLPRLTEFMATFEKAGTTLEEAIKNGDKALLNRAAANAADVTVNFGRSGSMGKAINKGFVPFFNPSVQGWSKFIRNFQEQPSAKAYLEFFAKAGTLGVGITAANNFLLKDNQNYQNISSRDKANNIIIPIPRKGETAMDTDRFIRIPQSRFASVLSLPGVNAFNENKMGWADMIKVANDQVAPINPIDNHILSVRSQMKKNETWYGTPIVPENLEENYAPSEQYDVNTSWFGKQLGKATSNLPEEMQISPKKADYLIDQETGIIGDVILPLTTKSRQGGGTGIQKYGPALLSPWTRPFTIDATTQNDLSSRFYDQLQKAKTANNSEKGGKAEEKEYKRLSEYSTELSSINQAIRHLQESDSETKLEDIKGLQKVKAQLQQDALAGKDAPSSTKTLDTVQKYVGTTYAIENFGSTADKKAMKIYGEAKYGNISDEEMQKKIDADKDFYKGVQSICKLEEKMEAEGMKSTTTLSKAVALASSKANKDVFEAYGCTNQSRTESANKMNRANTYFKDGGSEEEFVQLEKARKTMGKLSSYDEAAELEKAHDQLAKGEITAAELIDREKAIKYNANISYIGLATSLAQADAPERGYRLYDIKDKNIQKGINLAAMGYTARDYREMVKALDLDGNGYPSKKEITNYVANSGVADKATLYDALYSYQGKSNPFGTPTNYTREQAAAMGKRNGVNAIGGGGEFNLKADTSSGGSGYGGSGYGGYYHRSGSGRSKKAKVPTPKKISASSLKSGEALVSKKKRSLSRSTVPTLARVEAKIDLPTKKR